MLAVWQLRAVKIAEQLTAIANNSQVQIARASLILEIDQMFESAEMVESRIAIRALRNRADREAKEALRSGANNNEVAQKASELFSAYMTKLWWDFRTADAKDPALGSTKPSDKFADDAGTQYSRLTRLLGWMETIGRLTEQNLAYSEDMFALYDAMFIQVFGYFERHIADRRSDTPNPNERWLEKAEWFRNEARANQDKLKEQAKPAPSVSWLKWLPKQRNDVS